jgi:hypothetical protein
VPCGVNYVIRQESREGPSLTWRWGKPEIARRICATDASWLETTRLVIAARKLGLQAEAQSHLAKLQKLLGHIGAYQYFQVYAQ